RCGGRQNGRSAGRRKTADDDQHSGRARQKRQTAAQPVGPDYRRAVRRRHDFGRHAAQDRVVALRRQERREFGAHRRWPRAPLPAARKPDRPGRRHEDQLALMQVRRHLLRPAARLRRSRRAATAVAERLWLFDLDNTLHDTSHAIFPRIDQGMTAAVAEALDVDIDTANELRAKYWHRYGATVIGMVRHHGVDAHAFLRRSHDFDVNPLVRAESALADKLRRLPGRKVLLTNAPFDYARAVLRRLGILRQFDSI